MSFASKILFTIGIVFVAGFLSVIVRLSTGNIQTAPIFFIPLAFAVIAIWVTKPKQNSQFLKELQLYHQMLLLVVKQYDQTPNITNPKALIDPILKSLKINDNDINERMRNSLENILEMPKDKIEAYLKAASDTLRMKRPTSSALKANLKRREQLFSNRNKKSKIRVRVVNNKVEKVPAKILDKVFVFAMLKVKRIDPKMILKLLSLIIAAILVLMMIFNPSLKDFKEYSGLKDRYVRKTANYLIYSKYEDSYNNKTYIGVLMNFYQEK